MKIPIQATALLAPLVLLPQAFAAQFTESFDNVPAGVQCGDTWTNQNLIVGFTPTIASEDGTDGYCAFETDPGYIWLYPSRLRLDFSRLRYPVARIEADSEDHCGAGCSVLFAYSGTNNIGQVDNSIGQLLVLNFTNSHPDSCALRSFEGIFYEVRVYTDEPPPPQLSIQATNGEVVVSWPLVQSPYTLETASDLASGTMWLAETNNIQLEGTNFVHHTTLSNRAELFRLHSN